MIMKDVHIVLASASPRRRELLERLGWRFDVIPCDAEETRIFGEDPAQMVMRLARLKCEKVAPLFPDSLVISADTVVVLDGEIFGKPVDDADARAMLVSLSGRVHDVYSGLALFWRGKVLCDFDRTEVVFRKMSREFLESYVATGEPRGKAGAYAIQGRGGMLVQSIRGDYSTVVGLPLCLLGKMLELCGICLQELWEVQEK